MELKVTEITAKFPTDAAFLGNLAVISCRRQKLIKAIETYYHVVLRVTQDIHTDCR